MMATTSTSMTASASPSYAGSSATCNEDVVSLVGLDIGSSIAKIEFYHSLFKEIVETNHGGPLCSNAVVCKVRMPFYSCVYSMASSQSFGGCKCRRATVEEMTLKAGYYLLFCAIGMCVQSEGWICDILGMLSPKMQIWCW
mmetsp:Transcript_23925/g.40949  ORF Transcript_23925/g.40949 Transcript_23925/m.40949 type:complete len:141 (-) Transcript_23925:213-635(-)